MLEIGDNKAAVLAALYNAARPLGLGHLHYEPADMTEAEAEQLLRDNKRGYFDYVKGRVLKVDLSGDVFSPALYDRDNGFGAAEQAVAAARSSETA